MKKLTTFIILLLCAVSLFAQAPEKFSYQAVVRNTSNVLVTNAQVGVRVSILQGAATGNAVYVETHTATTNANGLLTIEIGGGTAQQGTFANIDWANGPYFLKTETDPNGGSNYTVTSTQQLLSVPYALYSKEAGNGFSGDYNDLTNKPTNVSAFNNDAGYVTNADIPSIPIYVSAFINDMGYITDYTETDPQFNAWDKDYNDLINTPVIPSVPTNVSTFTNDAGYITNADIPEIPTVPTNVSAFTNDVPYLTSEQQILSISNDTIFLTGGSFVKLPAASTGFSGDYNDLTNTPTIPQTVSELTNDANYITLEQVPAQVNADWNATSGAAEILNKPVIPTVPTEVSAFNNDAGYITNADIPEIPTVPTNVSAFTNDAGYITAAQCGDMDICALTELISDLQAQVSELRSALDSLMEQNTQDTTTADTATLPSVSTSSVSDITDSTATVTGVITDNGGATVIAYGVCWGIEHNPTVNDSHTTDSIDASTFTSIITNLSPSTTYYVRAYATNSEGTAYGEELSFTTTGHVVDGDPCPNLSTVTDYDGNTYNTIIIGQQCWMKENLRTKHYADGTGIAQGNCTFSDTTGYWYYPDGKAYLMQTYGLLYNWPAVMNNTSSSMTNPSGVQGICPSGWHVPSAAEWAQLTNYVSSQNAYFCDNNSNNIAKALAATTGWNSSTNSCAVGNVQASNNATGFGTLPAGSYSLNECQYGWKSIYESAIYSSATEATSAGSYLRNRTFSINKDNSSVSNSATYCDLGISVRCVHSETPGGVTTSGVSDIQETTATCGGNVVALNGETMTSRGVCWSTNHNPTLNDAHTNDSIGIGTYSSYLTGLVAGTKYYVRAYVTFSEGTNYGEEVSFTTASPLDGQPCSDFPTMTDFDGNVYQTVQIGRQCWITENLRTTQNNAGYIQDNECGAVKPYRFEPYNDVHGTGYQSEVDIKGYLYNWTAVIGKNGPVNNDSSYCQGICPEGWHVPSKFDWQELLEYVGGLSQYRCEDNPGYVMNALCESMSSSISASCDSGTTNSTGLSLRATGWYSNCWNYAMADLFIVQWTSSFGLGSYSDYPCIMEGTTMHPAFSHSSQMIRECMPVRCLKTPNDKIFSGNVDINNYFFSEDTLVLEITGITATGSPIREVGACWSGGGLCINLLNSQTVPYDPSHTGPVFIKLPNVDTTNDIYFKAFINLATGTIYSDMITLTVPSINTTEPTNITDSSASVGGIITSNGGYDVTACGVCWSTSSNPTVADDHTTESVGTGSFTSSLTGLNAGTTYYARAYATNQAGTTYGDEVIFTTTSVSFEAQPCPTTPTVTDIDGNVYNTVQIGNQCWIKENLRTSHYSDGTAITMGDPTGSETSSTTIPYYYDNTNSYISLSQRGYHYNWPAVMHGAASSNANPSGVQGVCPTGWHVPSNTEWIQLFDYMGTVQEYVCGDDPQNIAKALADTTEWSNNSNPCAVGNDISLNNASGFSAMPVGVRWFDGFYWDYLTYFCSSTESSDSEIYVKIIRVSNGNVLQSVWEKRYGYPVRCLRNEAVPTVTTGTVNDVMVTTATCSGEVTSDGGIGVTAYGVCWSTEPNPTINDNHTNNGSGIGTFTSMLTGLEPGTTYYVRAYATNSVGTAYGEETSFTTHFPVVVPEGDAQPCPGSETVTDIDGNTYNTVKIGNQCWMKENMRVTHYADGTVIPDYHDYSNSGIPLSERGYLYSWSVTMHGTASSGAVPSGVQGICPTGWHLPSDAEWTQLTDYVSSVAVYQCDENSSNIAKALASTTAWNSATGNCEVGYDRGANNASGFSAVPAGGYGSEMGWFNNAGNSTTFWSSTDDGDYVSEHCLCKFCTSLEIYSSFKGNDGGSVRCLRDY